MEIILNYAVFFPATLRENTEYKSYESSHLYANKQLHKSREWLMWPSSFCEKYLWVIVDIKLSLCQQNDEAVLHISFSPLPLYKTLFLTKS